MCNRRYDWHTNRGCKMDLNNLYNFKNAVRHFVNIDLLKYPADIENFSTRELCWTMPISFNVQKGNGKYRTLKIPNVLNFVRAYHYYSGLPDFDNIQEINPGHSRMTVNFDTGDFIAGEYDAQLNDDFMNLCLYDNLMKLDIKDFYGKLYSHYLPKRQLKDNVFTSMNNGRTGGIIMGNYLSLYFAENALKKIADDFETALEDASINCHFEYFSDDFYIFCNKYDNETIRKLFNQILAENDYEGNDQKIEIEDYESYNIENVLTRYWKAIMRHWNEEVLKDFQKENETETEILHKLSFLNQLIYRLSSVKKERNKQSLIRNFFKTKHFQETDFERYDVEEYNYHQLCFLLKMSPESLLYTSDIFNSMSGFDNQNIKIFLKARYREALISSLHDVQLYYYYAIRCYRLDWCLEDTSDLVLKSQNQILTSYYLKDGLFSEEQINSLKLLDNEKFWFQNYHLILYRPELTADLDDSIMKYLIPEKANTDPKRERYKKFYKENLVLGKAIINEVSVVTENIQEYLEKRHLELIHEDDNEIISEEEEFWI